MVGLLAFTRTRLVKLCVFVDTPVSFVGINIKKKHLYIYMEYTYYGADLKMYGIQFGNIYIAICFCEHLMTQEYIPPAPDAVISWSNLLKADQI